MPNIIKPGSPLTDQRKLVTFLGRRPEVLILYLDSILLMQLKVGQTKGRKARDGEFSLGASSLQRRLRV
jgi:hypothetical protein